MDADTEDKAKWCEHGADMERAFVNRVGPTIGLRAEINPAKDGDKYAIDLLIHSNGQTRAADLKYRTAPFFQAKERFGIDPQWAVTLNHKDVERYTHEKPCQYVIFWVDWAVTVGRYGGTVYRVQPMEGVWVAALPKIVEQVEIAKKVEASHVYERRKDDTMGNAKESYVLDVRAFTCRYLWIPKGRML